MGDRGEGEPPEDPKSSNFDPLKALYGAVKLPCPNAPALDNLSKFELGPEGLTIKGAPRKKEVKEVLVKKEIEKGPEPSTSSVARPLAGGKGRTYKDVFQNMERISGPLAVLRDCMERRVRVKIFTRDMAGIRGHCIAFVAAFDKVWNLALEDVEEVWTRKIKRKTPALGPPHRNLPDRAIRPPSVRVTRLDHKTERCERHVPQLLMRGEHVALISIV